MSDLWLCCASGFYALLLTAVAVGVALYQEVDLSYIHAHFLQFYTSALLIVTLLSIYLFIRSRWASEDELAPGGNCGKIFSVKSGCIDLSPSILALGIFTLMAFKVSNHHYLGLYNYSNIELSYSSCYFSQC